MSATHTPGPWTYDRTTRRIGTAAGTITNLQDSTGWAGEGRSIPHDEQAANAQLIAAAPLMLAALKGVVHHNDGLKDAHKLSPALMRHVQSAIDAATGNS